MSPIHEAVDVLTVIKGGGRGVRQQGWEDMDFFFFRINVAIDIELYMRGLILF